MISIGYLFFSILDYQKAEESKDFTMIYLSLLPYFGTQHTLRYPTLKVFPGMTYFDVIRT